MSSFYAMLGRLRHIKRWGLMRNTQPEDVLQHSAQCAMVAHALACLGNARLGADHNANEIAMQALLHETSEVLTGDLATPIKYFDPRIRDAYHDIERRACDHMLACLPDDLKTVYAPLLDPKNEAARLIKAADRICALIKCQEELRAGNDEFSVAFRQTQAALDAIECREAQIFMEEHFPAFCVTLDEQMQR